MWTTGVVLARSYWSNMRFSALLVIVSCLVACERTRYETTVSVEHSRDNGLLFAQFSVPQRNSIGRHAVVEVWGETNADSGLRQLVVRLDGPHHLAPEIRIAEFGDDQYAATWSERNGSPYKVWDVAGLLPDTLTLMHGVEEIRVTRQ